ncbi:NUDIX hydrolase [Sphingosinicella terrae]|uniref:NUDIX hydrolase n=1 Tax=Sphingosinicella terrae TaxID=2172047 RepID=UPI000E0D2244|nr:NUDIX domain-containing protein [Sphingosinicella terrae]
MTTSRCDDAPTIRIAAALIVDGRGRILLVRKRGTQAFMQPGGKLEHGETGPKALARELREELGCGFVGEPRPIGRYSAAAANEPGQLVEAELFAVVLDGGIIPAAEIEEAHWYDLDGDAIVLAPLTRDHVLPLVRSGTCAP